MDSDTKDLLTEALITLGVDAIDPDIWKVVEVEVKSQDPDAIAAAAKELISRHPRLFPKRDWEKLETEDADAFADRERAFKASLSKSRPFTNAYKDIDSSRLSEEELHALTRALSGHGNDWDKGLLIRAAARQASEDAALRSAAK